MLAGAVAAGRVFAAQGGPIGPLSVDRVRTGQTGETTRIVFDLSRQTDYRIFMLDNPYRLVVDFEPARWYAPKSLLTQDELLKGYRSGTLDDGLSRVIFDLRKPVVVAKSFTLAKDDFNKDRLVIDLQPSSVNLFRAKLPEVYGSRALKGPGASSAAPSEYRREENESIRAAPVPQDDNTRTAGVVPPKPRQAPSGRDRDEKRQYVIVVDAGHGGQDPGASSAGGVREKNITLSIARELRRQLQETGRYKVVMTRATDIYIPLRERVNISRRVHGDLFVSIHADKISRTNVRGASIYTLSEKASDKETEKLAESENNAGVVAGVDLADKSQDVADILLDLAMREKMNDSKLLAIYMEQAFRNENIRLLPNSHRSAGFAVLKAPDVPSLLIETGFVSNPKDAKLLTTARFQDRIGAAIVKGIDAYFRKIRALQKQ
ncbi:MAG: AMIN domain-containing protein [Alphaproteobacteria bacterium]|nr:AMIN domain-containing protein [Alphaproteobacteria bacterium]